MGPKKKEKSDSLQPRQHNENQQDGNRVNVFNTIQDTAIVDLSIANIIRNAIEHLPEWRKHTNSERLIFESIEASYLTVDKVSDI